jgi:hypothetical protein
MTKTTAKIISETVYEDGYTATAEVYGQKFGINFVASEIRVHALMQVQHFGNRARAMRDGSIKLVKAAAAARIADLGAEFLARHATLYSEAV